MAQSTALPQLTTGLFSLGGFIAAAYLSSIQIQVEFGAKITGLLCNTDGFLNCDTAAQSGFATLAGIPISVLGVAFYAAILAVIFFGALKSSPKTPSTHDKPAPFSAPALTLTLYGLSVLYSLFLLGVSLFILQSVCPFCALLYICNIGGFAAAWMWYGHKPHHALLDQLRHLSGLFKTWAPPVFVGCFIVALLASLSIRQLSIDAQQVEHARQQEIRDARKPIEQDQYRASHSPGLGPKDAPVVLVEFSSFTCPHCAQFSGVLTELLRNYPEQVRVEFRHFPASQQPDSNAAARAGVCAHEQQKFWLLHDLMFSRAPALAEPNILSYATEAGLNADQLQTCMNSELARRIVNADIHAAQALNIQGTPTLFINGRRFDGAVPYPELEKHIKAALQ